MPETIVLPVLEQTGTGLLTIAIAAIGLYTGLKIVRAAYNFTKKMLKVTMFALGAVVLLYL